MRLKSPIRSIRDEGATVQFVLGLDLGGTSKEVLREVASWGIPVTIVKNRLPGHIFHPKIYLVEWPNSASIIIGSNNATEGGFFRNYESAARVDYDFPADAVPYAEAIQQLDRFLRPAGDTARALTPEYLAALLARDDIPDEFNARVRTADAGSRQPGPGEAGEEVFGIELIAPAPPLPAGLLERLITRVVSNRRQAVTADSHGGVSPPPPAPEQEEQVAPAAFYMTLPKLQGPSIPGEARIPLPAIEIAQDFWGWPHSYARLESPRDGENRVYHEWKPAWRIRSVEEPNAVTTQSVRMYMYDNSSDFRFYARPLVTAGADLGDIVRITRIAEPDVEFECVLARQGTPQHTEWQAYCTTPVRNSTRTFGYG
jgi:hypothetical protein